MEFFNSEKYGFVSYSHKDSKKVVPIVQRMSAMGYRIWYDEVLPYLEDYNEVIGNALNGSSVFVVFLTKNSVQSEYVRSEIYRARDLKKPVCAVMLEQCELPQGLALRLAETNQIRRQDFADEETFFSCICSVVEKTGCRGYVQTTPQTVAQTAVKSTETKPQEAVSPLRKDWKQIAATVIKWILAVETSIAFFVEYYFIKQGYNFIPTLILVTIICIQYIILKIFTEKTKKYRITWCVISLILLAQILVIVL